MASKFAEFLETNKLDPRRVLVASRSVERLRPEDRRIRLDKRQKKPVPEGETPPKPRSGRAVTTQLLSRAQEGKAISGAAKSRLLRAVNHALSQKKKDPVELRALF